MRDSTMEFPTFLEALEALEGARAAREDPAVLDALVFERFARGVSASSPDAADKELLARYFVALCERRREAESVADSDDPPVAIPEVAIMAYLGRGVVARRVIEGTVLAVVRRRNRRRGHPWALRVRR